MKRFFVSMGAALVGLMLSAGALAETHSKNLDLDKSVQVNGTTLAPGSYKVTYDDSGATAQVTFMKGKNKVATAPAQIKKLDSKASTTSVILSNKTSVPSLEEIDFGGSTQGLVLSNAAAGATTGE